MDDNGQNEGPPKTGYDQVRTIRRPAEAALIAALERVERTLERVGTDLIETGLARLRREKCPISLLIRACNSPLIWDIVSLVESPAQYIFKTARYYF